jgi:hypothetical protein
MILLFLNLRTICITLLPEHVWPWSKARADLGRGVRFQPVLRPGQPGTAAEGDQSSMTRS